MVRFTQLKKIKRKIDLFLSVFFVLPSFQLLQEEMACTFQCETMKDGLNYFVLEVFKKKIGNCVMKGRASY